MKTIAFSFFLIALMALILLLWSLWVNAAFGATITHSHCPNHSRNNSDNMHTHDTSDTDHNDKHKAGHPHTWEFDEHCPPGTERDTSKKSNIQDFPTKPVLPIKTDGDEDVDDALRGDDTPYVPADCPSLTVYSIEVNDKDQIRLVGKAVSAHLSLFFDDKETTIYGVLIGWTHPKSLSLDDFNEWLDMRDLGIVSYYGSGSKKCCDNLFVRDAKRMVLRVKTGVGMCYVAQYPEPAPSAPSKHRNKTTTWASLKMR